MNIEEIIQHYNAVIRVVDSNANENTERAYGGMIRAFKGQLQEFITEELLKLAWEELEGDVSRIEINKKKVHIPIQEEYIKKIQDESIRSYIKSNKDDYYYGLSVDKHLFIDGKFVLAVECKAYTENAMLKRILVDFHLLKTAYPTISCYLFQLESQLRGDYSELSDTIYGSKSTHSIMSYFPDVTLQIVTLFKGERNIDSPIHKNFKPLTKESLNRAKQLIKNDLERYL